MGKTINTTIDPRRVLVAVIALALVPLGICNTASAQTITNTGPNSVNRITSDTTYSCSVTNHTQVSAANTHQQTVHTYDSADWWHGWRARRSGYPTGTERPQLKWHG
jgi:hypothetical protein